jgi:hypothetical protein
MIFIVAHFTDAHQIELIKKKYNDVGQEILLCGTCSIKIPINNAIPYHPIFWIENDITIAQQHLYIDTMCRALQMEVPTKIIFESATKLDNYTVLSRINEHAKIVGIEIV